MEFLGVLSVAGSLASLIGLKLQMSDKPKPDAITESKLDFFRGLANVADRWKKVHNHYHVIFHDLRSIQTHFDRYKAAGDINFGEFNSRLNQLPALKSKCEKFERDINVFVNEFRELSIDENQVNGKLDDIRDHIGNDYAIKAEIIYHSQNDAIAAHDNFSVFTKEIHLLYNSIGRKDVQIDFDKISKLYNNFENYYDSYNKVILKTDEILLNTIDFFKLIADSK